MSHSSTRANINAALPLGRLVGLLVVLFCTTLAIAQLPVPTSTQFDMTGFIQAATLNNSADPHSGGTLTVNNHVVTIPRETIVIFPANALSWQEVFARAPLPWGIAGSPGVATTTSSTGMAIADCANNTNPCTAPPLVTWEVEVVGNRVTTAVGGDQYIAGLVYISQQSLNSGSGFINFINYATGEMRVGGIIGNSATGSRVRINDPIGRYGRSTTSPDQRFTVDPDNPTISAGSAYPMCLPRTAPGAAAPGTPMSTTDSLCPEENRPVAGIDPISGLTSYVNNFTTANLTSTCLGTCVPAPVGTWPDSTKQVPFEVGDYITYHGTLVKDAPAGGFLPGDGPTVGPMPAATSTYIAAHTIEDNIAVFTFPGSNPAYVRTDVTIIGTGGLTVLGAGEAVVRTRFEGMTTDFSRQVHLYGMDLDPRTGATTDRDWGTIGVDPGPAGGVGAVQGRWRFRPPCLDFGTVPTKVDKQCVYPPSGTFLPPTREMRAVIEGLQGQAPGTPTATTAANGLFWGQYHAPILLYIFPENVPGSPIVENNFSAIPFLAQGGYSSSGIGGNGSSILAGQLSPWPGASAPTLACTPAQANSGGPYTIASRGSITLAGTASGDGPFTYSWAVSGGTLTNAAVANPVFTAPSTSTGTTVTATLTVVGACGTSSSSTTITVNPAAAPTVNQIAPLTVFSGTPVQLSASAIDPAGLPVSFVFTQQANGAPTVLNPNPSAATAQVASGAIANGPSFTLALPLGTPGVTLSFQVVATNAAGAVSAPETFTVTINPAPDVITITTAQYRTGKQRIDFTVTDSVVSPGVVLTLQPYLTDAGTIFDPSVLGNVLTNTGGGTYTMTLVGAPRPACNLGGAYATPCAARPFIIKSNLGGQSGPTALTNIRQ